MRVLRQYQELLANLSTDPPAPRLFGDITITGGEPFLSSCFYPLLSEIQRSRAFSGFSVLTNGSLVDESAAKRLRMLSPKFVQVSIEGTRETHDSIRGKGSYVRAVSGIRHLVEHHIPTMIAFTAHRANFREFSSVADLGRRLRVQRVWGDRYVPLGDGSDLEMLSKDETFEFVQLMQESALSARGPLFSKTEIAMHRALQFLATGKQPYHCTAGDTLLAVMPNGDVYPCRRMPITVGNVFETPLAEIYCHSEVLQSLRDRSRIDAECEGCAFANTCGGGLRCLSYATLGDAYRSDPGCWLVPGNHERYHRLGLSSEAEELLEVEPLNENPSRRCP